MKNKNIIQLIILCFLAYIISTHCFQLSLIQGNSMTPSYSSWQLVGINKLSKNYMHGDVIVFYAQNLDTYLTKRIVALPGDTVQIKNGNLYVNNSVSPHVFSDTHLYYAGIAETPITLEANQYFVIGDNYVDSKDSRYKEIGCITHESILGKLFPQIQINRQTQK